MRNLFRRWSLSVLTALALFAVAACDESSAPVTDATGEFPIEEATLDSLQEAMRDGRLTSRRIAEIYLDRIEALDRNGPTLRSVIEVNPDALDSADRLDAERREGRVRGPLHGIPIVIKDNIDTADRMMTTAGSLAMVGPAPSRDAFIVERLREAGAVLLGKANLSEWANFRSTRSTSGWSARGGLVRNPYALDRNACGSSSGTAVAVAANLAAAGVGTETDGSIVCPSAANALVGIKPTVGLVSRSGIVPIAQSQDTAGPMARSVRDAALLLSAMAGPDPRDPVTADATTRMPADYSGAFDVNGLRAARIGVLRGSFVGYSQDADTLFEAAIARLREAGAEIVDPVELPNANAYSGSELEVLLYEFKAGLNAYLAGREGLPVRSLADVIAFNESNREREMPFFGQDLFLQAERKGPLTEEAYIDARDRTRRLAGPEGIDRALGAHALDALIAPTLGLPWLTDLVIGDRVDGGSASPAAASGYPSITVPAGFAHGLPLGLSFIGPAWSEATLIRLAYAYEQVTRHRRPPTFEPTARLDRSVTVP